MSKKKIIIIVVVAVVVIFLLRLCQNLKEAGADTQNSTTTEDLGFTVENMEQSAQQGTPEAVSPSENWIQVETFTGSLEQQVKETEAEASGTETVSETASTGAPVISVELPQAPPPETTMPEKTTNKKKKKPKETQTEHTTSNRTPETTKSFVPKPTKAYVPPQTKAEEKWIQFE